MLIGSKAGRMMVLGICFCFGLYLTACSDSSQTETITVSLKVDLGLTKSISDTVIIETARFFLEEIEFEQENAQDEEGEEFEIEGLIVDLDLTGGTTTFAV